VQTLTRPLLLTIEDVIDLIDLPAAIDCLERIYEDQARGEVIPWPPAHGRSGGAQLIMRSGGLPGQGRYGLRISTGPTNPSYALIYGSPSGRLLSMVDYPFSDLRLQASVGVAIKHLAPKQVRRLGLIGSGRLALGLLEAIRSQRRFESVSVFSRDPSNRERFSAEASARLGCAVTAVASPRDAVQGAEIVLTATSSPQAALTADGISEHALVVSIGTRAELDESIFRSASCIVASSRVQELDVPDPTPAFALIRLVSQGEIARDAVRELGDVVSGQCTPPPGLVVFREAQGGFSDIALASLAFDRARELGRGVEATIGGSQRRP